MIRTGAVLMAMLMIMTGCASTESPATSTTPSAPSLRTLDLGGAQVRIPSSWHVSKYQGELATVIFPLSYISDHPLVGPCLLDKRSSGECTTNYWFPPNATTPDDGVLMLWQEWEFPGSYDRLATVPGRTTTIDHRPAKLYSGPVVYGGCPTDSSSQISAAVHSSTDHFHNGDGYYVVACLGPHVSAGDRRAVQAMISSLRISG